MQKVTGVFFCFAVSCWLGVAFQAGCDAPVPVGGGYSPVTAAEIAGMSTSHRTGMHQFEFNWAFDANRFLLEGDNLPDDLVVELLGLTYSDESGSKVNRVEGTWVLLNEQELRLTTTSPTQTEGIKLRIFRTGPIRIQTGKAQYVF